LRGRTAHGEVGKGAGSDRQGTGTGICTTENVRVTADLLAFAGIARTGRRRL